MDTFSREETLGSGRLELYQVVLGIDSSGFRALASLLLLFLGTVSLLFLGTELLLVLGTVDFDSTRRDWWVLGSWIQWRRLSCSGEVTLPPRKTTRVRGSNGCRLKRGENRHPWAGATRALS